MDEQFKSLLPVFLEETYPLIEESREKFLELERLWKLDESGEDQLRELKGLLHTAKGNSAMMGFDPLKNLIHTLEDLCENALKHEELKKPATASLLIRGGDLLAEYMNEIRSENFDGSLKEKDLSQFTEEIQEHIKNSIERRKSDRRSGIEWRSGDDRRKGEDRRSASAGASTKSEFYLGAPSDTIRIDFKKLDLLLETLGEAWILHGTLSQLFKDIEYAAGSSQEISDTEKTLTALGKILKQLQQEIMDARLLPVSTVLNRFNRLVRDLSNQLNKPAVLTIEGQDTRVDKRILDRLGEPLLHLVRNAMAHGIESPEERKAAGKDPEGNIRINARPSAGQIVISVEDDGKGLDTDAIKKKAEQMGIDTSGMQERDLWMLIFTPGFSTAGEVSTLAGRGVGMDVVMSKARELGGSIEVTTKKGAGTRFDMILPMTLTLIKCLLIETDGETYGIPLNNVLETSRYNPETVDSMQGTLVIKRNEEIIKLIDAGWYLGIKNKNIKNRNFLVTVFSGSRKAGLLVDKITGHRDIVLKKPGNILNAFSKCYGVTVMGDGRVVFVIDPAKLVQSHALSNTCRTTLSYTAGV